MNQDEKDAEICRLREELAGYRARFGEVAASAGVPVAVVADAAAHTFDMLDAEQQVAAMLDGGQRQRFDAIVRSPPPAPAARRTVWVAGPDGAPRPVAVRLGIGDGSVTEVVDGDLAAGQEVITGLAPAEPGGGRGGGIRLSF